MRQAVDTARKHLFEISQKLGGGFERRGLKLFKRRAGKLFVSRVKPRAVDPGVVFSERVARIVELLKTAHGLPLTELVEKIVPSAAPGPGGAKPAITEDQVAVIKDVRWLANEGYVIEYADGMVFLGVQGEPAKAKPEAEGKPAVAEPPATESSESTEACSADTAPEAGEVQQEVRSSEPGCAVESPAGATVEISPPEPAVGTEEPPPAAS
jgi:hypothetical protein